MTILTTVVGSYPVPDWLTRSPSEQALRDATAVVIATQERAGIDLVADGELYRFDPDHPETNGMIESFTRPLAGVRAELTRGELRRFEADRGMRFRARPAGVVTGEIGEGALDLVTACRRARSLATRPLKFTLTGPHMLARTLSDRHYGSTPAVCEALAAVLAAQVADLDADVVQVDEANLPGHPGDWEWALTSINRVLDAVPGNAAVHLCFGNYGGQTIQEGRWGALVEYLSGLHADHVHLEMTRRSPEELVRLGEVAPPVRFGVGVIDIKTTIVETPEDVALRIETAADALGLGRIAYVAPDCGFWMLPRSVADRKIRALVEGRDLFEGRR